MFGLLPDSLRGRLIVNEYVRRLKTGKPGDISGKIENLSAFNRAILRQNGNVSAMYKYLSGDGKKLIPEIVEGSLGNYWYTGLAKRLANTEIGNSVFMGKFLDKTLPTINGDNSLAQQFLAAGGNI